MHTFNTNPRPSPHHHILKTPSNWPFIFGMGLLYELKNLFVPSLSSWTISVAVPKVLIKVQLSFEHKWQNRIWKFSEESSKSLSHFNSNDTRVHEELREIHSRVVEIFEESLTSLYLNKRMTAGVWRKVYLWFVQFVRDLFEKPL